MFLVFIILGLQQFEIAHFGFWSWGGIGVPKIVQVIIVSVSLIASGIGVCHPRSITLYPTYIQ
jgi:hypothetical protein